jgi:hypothetical protein
MIRSQMGTHNRREMGAVMQSVDCKRDTLVHYSKIIFLDKVLPETSMIASLMTFQVKGSKPRT